MDIYCIGTSIDNQILKIPHDILVRLTSLGNGRKTDICTLNKDRVDIFSEYFTKIIKTKLLRYVNEVLFKIVKTALKDTYLGGTTPTELQH